MITSRKLDAPVAVGWGLSGSLAVGAMLAMFKACIGSAQGQIVPPADASTVIPLLPTDEGWMARWANILISAAKNDGWGFLIALALVGLVVLLNVGGREFCKRGGFPQYGEIFESNAWRYISVFLVAFAGGLLMEYAAGMHFGQVAFVEGIRVGEAAIAAHQGYKQVLAPLARKLLPGPPEASNEPPIVHPVPPTSGT